MSNALNINTASEQPDGKEADQRKDRHKDALFPWPDTFKQSPGSVRDPKFKTDGPRLFSPFQLRDLVLKNRIVVSPMCQYSARDGMFSDWHLVHLGQFAIGGAGLIFTEATAVSPIGRISPYVCNALGLRYENELTVILHSTPQCTGIWSDDHVPGVERIVNFAHELQTAIGMQLAHAGRKASTEPPWMAGPENGAIPQNDPRSWQVVGPSPLKYADSYNLPHELSKEEIKGIMQEFVDAARRCEKAGFDVLEIHGAHGYLMSSFCSPTSNKRTDEYGGTFEGRTKFLIETVVAVRNVWPQHKPLFLRLSCYEWVEDGWSIEDTVRLAKIVHNLGVDVLDCSSGGNNASQQITVGPGFQVPFSEAVKRQTTLATCAVGAITDSHQAEQILVEGKADLIAIARELLRNPHWAFQAAFELGVDVYRVPQYARAHIKPNM